MKFNPTIATDAYKITHWLQRPENMTRFYNYGEPRLGGQHDAIIFAELQYILKEYFMRKVTQEDIEEGAAHSLSCFGFDHYFPREIWEKVKNLGYFPLRIKAVKEGTLVPTSNVCFTMEATEDWFAPMVSHFEDWLMWVWYSCAVATRAFNIKRNIKPFFEKSCDDPFLQYAVNDFGYRGGTFNEGACVGGAAHLISFDGTDNLQARKLIQDYYGGQHIGGSVWATEHSVATVWGPGEGEYNYVKAQLTRSHPTATISIVIDSYDSDNFMKNVISREDVKQLILDRPGRTVFRPDSGDPLTNVCKYTEVLGNIFGYRLNTKGYKVLNHNVGIIQGDGMTEKSIPELYNEYIKTGWSAENVITGSGGGLLEEGLTRDTDRWAIKVSYVEIDGKAIDIRKTPKTDMTKASKAGILKLHKSGGKFMTIESSKEQFGINNGYTDELRLVFENGVLYNEQTFDEIRQIANSYL